MNMIAPEKLRETVKKLKEDPVFRRWFILSAIIYILLFIAAPSILLFRERIYNSLFGSKTDIVNKTSNESRTKIDGPNIDNRAERKTVQKDADTPSVDNRNEFESSINIWIDKETGIEFMKVPNKNLWISKNNVNMGQFRKFIKLSGYKSNVFFDQPGCESLANPTSQHSKAHTYKNDKNIPVICISWYDATAFADWMTKENRKGYKFSLPTETEWQYACHLFESKFKFEEWCKDIYRQKTGDRILGRVTRGFDGGWSSPIPYCEWRHGRRPNEGGPLISFRVVRKP